MNCKICGVNEVIYSGVDAFVLGVETETVCYGCANTYSAEVIRRKLHFANGGTISNYEKATV